MNRQPLFLIAGLLAAVAGCTTTPVKVSRGPIKADAHFTLAHVDVSQVDVPPKVVKLDHPLFLLADPADGVGEYAVVQFIIDPQGIPREVQWVEASDAAFARAAAKSAAASRYSPARMDGKTVAAKVELRFEVRYAANTGSYWSIYGGHDYQANAMRNRYDANGIFVDNYQPQ